jgi:hypothetical protein
VLGGRLCPLCTSAINLLFPTIELISLSNDIAVQIGVNDEDVSGIDSEHRRVGVKSKANYDDMNDDER